MEIGGDMGGIMGVGTDGDDLASFLSVTAENSGTGMYVPQSVFDPAGIDLQALLFFQQQIDDLIQQVAVFFITIVPVFFRAVTHHIIQMAIYVKIVKFFDIVDHRLEKKKEELEERKAEIDEIISLLDRQKKATRNVNPSYTEWMKKCEEISLAKKQIKSKESELERAVAAAERAKAAFDHAKEQEPEVDKLKQAISRIDDEEQKYQQKEELEKKQKELEESDNKISTEEAELKESEKSLKEKIKSFHETVKEFKGKPSELIEAKNESEKLSGLLADLNEVIDGEIPEREKREKKLRKNQKEFLDVRDKYDEVKDRREQAERIFEDSRAGILAEKLVEGKECPVCGSLHHPKPAKLKESWISESDRL